jgi:fibronectin type 3 domain-containing protein
VSVYNQVMSRRMFGRRAVKQPFVLALCAGSLFLASCSGNTSLQAPQNLRVTPGEDKVDLSWEDRSENEAGFAIYRSVAGESNVRKLEQTAPANAETYTDTNVDTTNTYIYQVRAFATDGSESDPSISEAVSATKLAAPSNLRASALNATSGESNIELTWTDNSSLEDGFRIFRRLESEASFPSDAKATVTANITSYSDTDVTPGSSYVYQVVAFVGTNVSDASGPSAPVTPTDTTTPVPTPEPTPAPVISSFTAPQNDTDYAVTTKITLSWTIDKPNEVSELSLQRVGGETIALAKTDTSREVMLPDTAVVSDYVLTLKDTSGSSSSKTLTVNTGTKPKIVGLAQTWIGDTNGNGVEDEGEARDFRLTWTMEGTAPFTFETTLGGRTQTVTATVTTNGYSLVVTRPALEDDTQPGVLTAINTFGSGPQQSAIDEGTF